MDSYLKPHSLNDSMVASIGFFDGVHRAHQSLIKKTIQLAHKANKVPVVITFDRHPKSVIFGIDFKYITPLKQKIQLLKAYGFVKVFVLPFDKALSEVDAHTFIHAYLKGVHTLVCGFDFRFGHGGKGTVQHLQNAKLFKVHVVDEIRAHEQKVSSTVIRELIEGGQMGKAHALLNRYFAIQGHVIHGEKKGRLIGYPTANIELSDTITPKNGVYATITQVDDTLHPSMTSVGHNPTLNASHPLSVESYIFAFDAMIYGKTITTFFIQRLRDEKKFDQVSELIQQIDQDAADSLTLLKPINLDLQDPQFML